MSGMIGWTPRKPMLVVEPLGPPDPAWNASQSSCAFDVLELLAEDRDTEIEADAERLSLPYRAISATEERCLDDPRIWECHRTTFPHWSWIAEDADRFPATPFLLTSVVAHRFIHHGKVELIPSDAVRQLAERDFRQKGRSDLVVTKDHWFGFVRLWPASLRRGECWIFADREVDVIGRHDNVRWDHLDMGSIIVPHPNRPDAARGSHR